MHLRGRSGLMTAVRARALGVARLLLVALALQLALPALGLTGAVASVSGEDIAVCSVNGMQVVHLDGGQPSEGTRKGEPSCVFCLPLLGAASPPADEFVPAPAIGATVSLPAPASVSREYPRHHAAHPRAPPFPT